MPDPREDEQGHADAVVQVVRDLVHASDGGMFVLFTSHGALRRAAVELRGIAGARWPLLVQGEAPRDVLLRRFRELGRAILLGTDSFWEGVDVPGRALRALVLTKLPFKVPSEPITAARLERLAEQGEDGFMHYLLPHAGLKLKQGFGRLIRARTDAGVVLLLDRRVLTKRYGPLVLSGLPRADRVIGTLVGGADAGGGLLRPSRHRSERMMPVKPSKIVCVGRNYVAHAQELGNEVPPEPLIFLKPPSSLLAPGAEIVMPPESQQVEYEAEIGVVMLERLRNVTLAQAERARLGFTCVNDVTARDLQKKDGQWGRAKGFDTFCPVGPAVVEGLDWRTLEVTTRVNGAVKQHGQRPRRWCSVFRRSWCSSQRHDARTGRPDRDGDAGRSRSPGVGGRHRGRGVRRRRAPEHGAVKASERLTRLPGYPMAELPAIKRALLARGVDVIDLGAGDADYPPPTEVIEVMQRAVAETRLSKYGFQQGNADFRRAAVDWMQRRFGIEFDPTTEVLPLIGSKEGLSHLPLALIDPGDLVVVPEPGYQAYLGGTVLAGGDPSSIRSRRAPGSSSNSRNWATRR